MKKVLTFFMAVCTVSALSAQQENVEKKDTTGLSLREVVITAQRSRQENLVVPYSVNVLAQEDLSVFNPRTTPEALMGMNGVFIQKTNHGGGSPFVRGVTGNQTLVLIDGIRLNNSTFRYGPDQYLNTIDAYSINRIEVAKGTGSVQYGTDAIGGVVHVFTKEPHFATGKKVIAGKLIAKYMSGNMEKTVRGETSYSGKKLAILSGISKRSFGDIIGGDTTGKQSPSGYEEWSFDVKARIQLSEKMQLTLMNQFLRQQRVPVYHKIILENFSRNEMEPQQRWLSYARLNLQGNSSLIKETDLTISFQQGLEGRISQKNNSTILRRERDKTGTIGITADISSSFNKIWTANSGIEIYIDRVTSKREDIDILSGAGASKRGLYPDQSAYQNYSLYSLHHFHHGRWVLDAGLRFNTFSINIRDTTLGDVKITPSALVSNAALLYSINRDQSVYVSFSSGYRAPNVDDMGTLGIVDFRYEIPTADLHPEKSQHTELGYKYKGKKVSVTAAFYYLQLNNLITRVKVNGEMINGYQVYKKENTESAFIKGMEMEWSYQLTNYLTLSSGIAYTYGQNISKSEALRRIPPFNGRVIGTYRIKKWLAAAEWQFAGKQSRLAQGDKEDNRIPAGGTPGWNLLNVYGGYTAGKIQLNIGMQNLFNKDYRTHGSGINGVGRSAWLSLSLKI